MNPHINLGDHISDPAGWLEDNGQLEEAEAAARRIKAYLFADKFLQYSEDTTLLDAVAQMKSKHRHTPYILSLSRDSYDNWPDRKGENGWSVILRVLSTHNITVSIIPSSR